MIPALEHRWKQLLLLVSSAWILLSFVVNVLAVPNLVQNTEANLWGFQQHLTSLSFGLLVAYPAARATIGPSPRPCLEWQTFLVLAVVVQVALAPLALLLRQPIELLLQTDAWLMGCAMWGCGAGRIMRERLAFGYALLALPLFAMLFDSHWSVPTAAASVVYDVYNPGHRPPPPLWFVTILVGMGWLWMTRPRRPFPGENTNDHHSEGTV
ncbi:MAG: hypothetical protein CMJ37_00355 [Phycisphaerae bacterium]|nr:hypothetical protein [Phycisphaerae bacterium]